MARIWVSMDSVLRGQIGRGSGGWHPPWAKRGVGCSYSCSPYIQYPKKLLRKSRGPSAPKRGRESAHIWGLRAEGPIRGAPWAP
jgi:hypothetical protein